MTLHADEPHDNEELLQTVLLDYVEALEAGREPDRQEVLTRYPELRPDLEAFFASHDAVERLAAPLRDAAWMDPAGGPEDDVGQLGDFRLLREIGRGGMGIVYEAEQISLRRRVALKILPFAAALDPRQLQRFKNEALAAAHLHHSNIVPVHAVGYENGVHYYAMQYIEGKSLAALVNDLRRLSGQPQGGQGQPGTNVSAAKTSPAAPDAPTVPVLAADDETTVSLSRAWAAGNRKYFDWVAVLGRQAALALEYAHQMGITHRDVKPGNLLLDPRGQLWVTDFGLAQVAGDPGMTVTGEMLGTLRYASPEQLQARPGVVDHRSDIYSLGATLYELLTLRHLFKGNNRNTLLRRIADDEPRAPRSVVRAVPRELETILLKALRKEPLERYASAQEMADDLQRFLDNRPVLARRPTRVERLRKWARRHPVVIVAAALVLALSTLGSGVSAALIRAEQARTQAAQQQAEEAYRQERQRAEQAEARLRLAQRSVTELMRVSEEELVDRPGMEVVRKRLLGSALAYYQELIDQRRDDPGAQAELLETSRHVEMILADLAVVRAASKLYLLSLPAVLDELQLDGEQREEMKELTTRMTHQWLVLRKDLCRQPQAEWRRRHVEQARADEADVNALLSSAQQQRLRQLSLQAEGYGAFRDPEVVAELQLSAGQREQLRALEDESFFAGRKPNEPATGRGGESRNASARERVLAVLTPQQAKRWEEMAGTTPKGFPWPHPHPFPPLGAPRRMSGSSR